MSPNDQAANDSDSVENTINTSDTIADSPTSPINVRVNWVHQNLLPRELRDKTFAFALPRDIVIHDGVLCSDVVNLLSIDRDSRKEFKDTLKPDKNHFVLEYSSNTAMLHGLDSLPAGSLASHTNLTITVKGSYNGHSLIYSNHDDCHRTNISPTLRRKGGEVWFEVLYPCLDCERKAFYQRELQFACPTILGKFERLTGMAFAAGVVDLKIHIHEDGQDIPHVYAYKLTEIWQPWKHVLRGQLDDGWIVDSLDTLYSDGDRNGAGERYGGYSRSHGLGVWARESEHYLIL